ncbi:MAG: type VI secretion system protein TssA [Bacteroidetes bacterium]|jgi:type VI secretion system protein VasJ|nr:type VI secretion system protein TssA [Bacteroidota bacterium]
MPDTAVEPLAPLVDGDHPLAAVVDRVAQPITDDAPCGEDVKYDDDFQAVKQQINQIGSVRGEVDFDKVVSKSYHILETKSKDLMTASYLSLALARTRGSDGALEGLLVLHTLMRSFWEGLHPQKPIRRRNALQFVSDRLQDAFELWDPPQPEEREALELAVEASAAIQAYAMAALGEQAPALSGLTNGLRERVRRLPKPPEPEDEASRPSADDTSGDTSGEGPAPTRATGPRAAVASAADARSAVIEAATFLRDTDATNLVPYRLLRSLRWDILTDAPPNENNVTRLEPPLEQRRTYLRGLLEKGEHETLLTEGERSFQDGTFHVWLDLQRLIISALNGLGAAYAPLAEALTTDLAVLVRRVPALLTLRFTDDTPFAEGLTVEWIDTTVRPTLAAEGATSGKAQQSEEADPLADAYAEARTQSGSDLAAALATLQAVAPDGTQRFTFRRRLYEATLCTRAGQHTVARALLESLADDIRRHQLHMWEPRLALAAQKELYACYTALASKAAPANKAALHEKSQQALDAIAQMDAAQALGVQ